MEEYSGQDKGYLNLTNRQLLLKTIKGITMNYEYLKSLSKDELDLIMCSIQFEKIQQTDPIKQSVYGRFYDYVAAQLYYSRIKRRQGSAQLAKKKNPQLIHDLPMLESSLKQDYFFNNILSAEQEWTSGSLASGKTKNQNQQNHIEFHPSLCEQQQGISLHSNPKKQKQKSVKKIKFD